MPISKINNIDVNKITKIGKVHRNDLLKLGGIYVRSYQVASGSVTLANMRMDLSNTNSFAWFNGVDLSPYQTGEYELDIRDSANRLLKGYILNDAPAGETLGVERLTDPGLEGTYITTLGTSLVTNSTFDSDISNWTNDPANPFSTFEFQANTLHMVQTGVGSSGGYSNQFYVGKAGIYRLTLDVTLNSGATYSCAILKSDGTWLSAATPISCTSGSKSLDFGITIASTTAVVFFWGTGAVDFNVDNVYVKSVSKNCTDWIVAGAMAFGIEETVDVHGGSKAQRVTNPGNADNHTFYQYYTKFTPPNPKECYKRSLWLKVNSMYHWTNPSYPFWGALYRYPDGSFCWETFPYTLEGQGWKQSIVYGTAPYQYYYYFQAISFGWYGYYDVIVDDCSFKQVTDPPSTGVHIVSSIGGATRAWNRMDTEFNYNDTGGYTYEVRRI